MDIRDNVLIDFGGKFGNSWKTILVITALWPQQVAHDDVSQPQFHTPIHRIWVYPISFSLLTPTLHHILLLLCV